MTAPRPYGPRETVDAPVRPATPIAEPTSLVPAAATALPEAARAGALTAPAGDARHATTRPTESAGNATLRWACAALAMAAGGSVLALGTRALLERVAGPVPYDLPSRTGMLVAIGMSSAVGAAIVAWTREPARSAKPEAGSIAWSIASNGWFSWMVMSGAFMLHDTYKHAGEIDTSRGGDLPLAVAERRAELRPAHMASQYALGAAYYRAGRYRDAERALQYLRAMGEGVPHFRRYRVGDHPSDEQVWPPEEVYSRATALYILARAHLAASDSALDLYRKAYAIGGPSAEVSRALYDALVAERQYGEARTVAGTYLQRHPGDVAWRSLYRAAWDVSRRAEAASMSAQSGTANPEITRFEKMARRAPNDAYPEAYLAYAELKVVLGTQLEPQAASFDRPLIHARRAVVLAPKNADYQAQLGLILSFGQHWSSADSAFAAAVALDPRVLERHDGFDAAWATARARMVGENGPGIERFMLEAPRRP